MAQVNSSEGGATIRSGVINLMNTILGAGLLSVPYAIRCDGVLLGILFVLFSAFTSGLGLYLLAISASYTIPGHASFFSLSKLTVPQLGIVFDLAIAIKCFGVACSYLIVVGDLMPQIMDSLCSDRALQDHPWLLSRTLWITLFLAAILPLVYKRKLDSLKTASLVALSSVGYLVILVVVHFLHIWSGGKEDFVKGPVHLLKPNSVVAILASFPILVFGFTCHQNQLGIINELHDRSLANVTKMNIVSIGTACVLYIIVGLSGYLTFGDTVSGNIIAMYPNSLSSTIGRIAIVILVTLSYPLQSNPARASINHVAYYINDSNLANSIRSLSRSTTSSTLMTPEEHRNLISQASTLNGTAVFDDSFAADEENEGEHYVKLTNTKLVVITTIIVVTSYIVAITVKSLAHVLAIVGSTGSTSISFILPGFFAYRLIGYDSTTLSTREWILKYAGLLLLIWGFIVMIICLSATLFLGATH
ncbi:hypothetical protein KL932_001571 [Ogataea haglerorum]|uniref:uncharacterized protein n=1 Tax=Ogataea haglerorum TaxID=1937702 RepID=UPI001C893876|nr:uncharacterized protein KL911_003838 [Ogataea haglerorum]KAG7695114.1 hypothetical protein KL915_003347 [Ogataea haglerorum]KAG7743506.1 hypothetical protein KL932_001571 [Ogataea haglerorum]KAG7746976.1 hypothetical protein KL912_003588 [Ogataea haglerorum]KAG7752556.1 hypothetical protein KL911_003838 [Ogataea haglerorum]KAG7809154.1 hypothetical protein KL924_003208 [Ogataea haglerorum]